SRFPPAPTPRRTSPASAMAGGGVTPAGGGRDSSRPTSGVVMAGRFSPPAGAVGQSGRVRIVHVFKDAFPPTYGGVEQHIWDVTHSLRHEFDFSVLAASGSRRRLARDDGGVPVVQAAEYGRVLSTPICPSWWGELRALGSAALHLHLPLPAGELL